MWGEHAFVYVKDGANSVIYLIELFDGINKEFQGKFFEDYKVSYEIKSFYIFFF